MKMVFQIEDEYENIKQNLHSINDHLLALVSSERLQKRGRQQYCLQESFKKMSTAFADFLPSEFQNYMFTLDLGNIQFKDDSDEDKT